MTGDKFSSLLKEGWWWYLKAIKAGLISYTLMGSSALYAWLTGGGLGCCRSDLVMGLGLVVIIVWAFVFLIFKLFRYNKWAKDFENRLVSYLQEVHTPLDIFKNSKGISRLQGRVFSSWIKSLIYRGLVAGEIDLRNGIYKPKDIS